MRPPLTARLLLLAGPLLGPGTAAALPLVDCRAPAADCSLRQAGDQAGVRVGAAAAPHLIASDPLYGPALAADFNSLTAENAMKWPQIQPAAGTWNFAPADALVDFATAHGMRVRGHTLLWANPVRIPSYVGAAQTPEEARSFLTSHIQTLVGRYAGRVDAWDVVNEPLQNLSDGLFDNVFLQQLGPDYVAEAFRLAHAADPAARLFLNEIFVDVPGTSRFDAFYGLVQGLLADGVPIHGVGLQTHLIAGLVQPPPGVFEAAVRAYADLGLAVEITEMDVALPGGAPDRLERQRRIYREIMGACLAVAACEGVTFWGFTDRYSWLDAAFGPGLEPLLLDVDYARKPAWFGAREALAARIPEPSPALLWLAAALAWLASGPARRGAGGWRRSPGSGAPPARGAGRRGCPRAR